MSIANSRFAPQSALTRIAAFVLAAPAASFDFPAIPQTFEALMLDVFARSDAVAFGTNLGLTFNADVGANYEAEAVIGNGGAVAAADSVAGTQAALFIPAANSPASAAGVWRVHIPAYRVTVLHKQLIVIGGYEPSGVHTVNCQYGRWLSLAAVNRLTLTPTAGQLVAGSRAILYGLQS